MPLCVCAVLADHVGVCVVAALEREATPPPIELYCIAVHHATFLLISRAPYGGRVSVRSVFVCVVRTLHRCSSSNCVVGRIQGPLSVKQQP